MILKGKQRAHGRQLGLYLLKIDQNEHVEIHELRGFISDDLPSALSEIDAISKGTRAEQALFSLALNPPPGERVSSDVFEAAVEQVEQKLGLAGQPRAIVFHEKEGRRHAHAVWSRIDAEKMKAINLPFFKMKLKDISRELFFEHGWEVPAGLIDRRNKSPLNYSLEEWQQTRRTGLNPKAVKQAFQQSWAISDSRKAFAQALLDQGFVLARGDRRGFVAIDYQGEAYAIAKYTGIRTKAVKERLGDPKELPSVEEAKAKIAANMTDKLKTYLEKAERDKQRRSAAFEFKRKELVERQRSERSTLEQKHKERWEQETNARAKRLSSGLKGIWHRLTGKYTKAKQQNEMEALQAMQRDRKEKDDLIFMHLEERKQLSLRQKRAEHSHEREIDKLRQDIEDYRDLKTGKSSNLRDEYRKRSELYEKERKPAPKRDKSQDRGHEPEL